MDGYDVVVLGAGPAGEVIAGRLAQALRKGDGSGPRLVDPSLPRGLHCFAQDIPGDDRLRRGRFVGMMASRGPRSASLNTPGNK